MTTILKGNKGKIIGFLSRAFQLNFKPLYNVKDITLKILPGQELISITPSTYTYRLLTLLSLKKRQVFNTQLLYIDTTPNISNYNIKINDLEYIITETDSEQLEVQKLGIEDTTLSIICREKLLKERIIEVHTEMKAEVGVLKEVDPLLSDAIKKTKILKMFTYCSHDGKTKYACSNYYKIYSRLYNSLAQDLNFILLYNSRNLYKYFIDMVVGVSRMEEYPIVYISKNSIDNHTIVSNYLYLIVLDKKRDKNIKLILDKSLTQDTSSSNLIYVISDKQGLSLPLIPGYLTISIYKLGLIEIDLEIINTYHE